MLGSLYDAINRLEYSFEWSASIPSKTKAIEYYFDDLTVSKLQELLNDKDCISKEILNEENYCSDCGGHTSSVLNIVYNLTPEEKQKDLDNCLRYRRAAIHFISKCLERNPSEIECCNRVLKSKNLEIFLNKSLQL